MRVLVTGGAGFLGGHVVAALRAAGHDCDVPGLDRPRVDLTDPAAVSRWVGDTPADALVHCAWYDGDDRISAAQNEDWVGHTERLLDLFARSGRGRAITVGTCLEYEFGTDLLVEDVTPLRPHSPYGRAKADVAGLVARFTAEGSISGAHARVGYVYGPGEQPPRLVPDLVESLAAGRRFASTSGTQRRDYLYAADVGTAIAVVLASDFTGPINVGSGTAIPVVELIRAVAREMRAEHLLDVGHLPSRPGDPEVIRLAIGRVTGLGWRPDVDLREGVRRTVRSMLPPTPDEATTR